MLIVCQCSWENRWVDFPFGVHSLVNSSKTEFKACYCCYNRESPSSVSHNKVILWCHNTFPLLCEYVYFTGTVMFETWFKLRVQAGREITLIDCGNRQTRMRSKHTGIGGARRSDLNNTHFDQEKCDDDQTDNLPKTSDLGLWALYVNMWCPHCPSRQGDSKSWTMESHFRFSNSCHAISSVFPIDCMLKSRVTPRYSKSNSSSMTVGNVRPKQVSGQQR